MFKKALLLAAMTTSILGFESGKLPTGSIKNLTSNYVSPRGNGNAQYINLSEFGEYTDAALEVENYNGLLMFMLDDKNFEIDISMLGVTDADKIDLKAMSFNHNENEIKLSASSLKANDPDFNASISSPSINCRKSAEYDDVKDQILSACLTTGYLSLGRINFQNNKSHFYNLVDEGTLGSSFKLDYLKLNINRNSFKGEFKGDVSKGIKVKMEGNTWYNPESNVVKIKIDKAKAGFINIKNTIFKELKNNESDKLRVDKPYIFISLED
jgi:hypothetical protein